MNNWEEYNENKNSIFGEAILTEMFHHDPKNFGYTPYGSEEYEKQQKEAQEQHIKLQEKGKISKSHRDSLEYYQGFGSKILNKRLLLEKGLNTNKQYFREPSDEEYKESKMYDKHISNFISKTKPLNHEAHVYSGLSFDPSKHFEQNNGVFQTPAYTSTSLRTHTAKYFAMDHIPSSDETKIDRHILHFKLPVGYNKGRYLDATVNDMVEAEYLLHKNQKI